ncbi:pilus assembly protein CpaF [Thermoflavimicrobium dichotomicum]|uniref:Pilus assembly protein CpaF n=2 Tax=Thermoflavimicrobium dichotomicum TaxID=46223 RepID=A0A1I3QTM6_9BACL|nr:pilus assembly protein CpaF [Thermoflavimicrobium dichotomicum]
MGVDPMGFFSNERRRKKKWLDAPTQKRSLVGEYYLQEWVNHFKSRILRETDLEQLTRMPVVEQRLTLNRLIHRYLSEEQLIISSGDREQLINQIIDESVGFGPLEPLLKDETITEIIVNGPFEVYCESNGKLSLTDIQFRDEEALRHVIERIVAPIGRRIDVSSPMVDARLPDGSRVNVVIPPISLKGPLLTIRKFRKEPIRLEELVSFGSLTQTMAEFLIALIRGKQNLVISGGTGSGKTTLLNALACYIPEYERIVTIEDMAELRIPHPHVAAMEARPPNVEGKGEITIRQLVRNALRMRPDRMIIGEVRGAEAFDMLQAMNTGHEGSLTTIHANSPDDALDRLEAMVMMSDVLLPAHMIRSYLAGAIDIIIQVSRMKDGRRRMLAISELIRQEDGTIQVKDIFRFVQTGITDEEGVQGDFIRTEYVPKCLNRLKAYGEDVTSLMRRGNQC